jgi:hypothetical protein
MGIIAENIVIDKGSGTYAHVNCELGKCQLIVVKQVTYKNGELYHEYVYKLHNQKTGEKTDLRNIALTYFDSNCMKHLVYISKLLRYTGCCRRVMRVGETGYLVKKILGQKIVGGFKECTFCHRHFICKIANYECISAKEEARKRGHEVLLPEAKPEIRSPRTTVDLSEFKASSSSTDSINPTGDLLDLTGSLKSNIFSFSSPSFPCLDQMSGPLVSRSTSSLPMPTSYVKVFPDELLNDRRDSSNSSDSSQFAQSVESPNPPNSPVPSIFERTQSPIHTPPVRRPAPPPPMITPLIPTPMVAPLVPTSIVPTYDCPPVITPTSQSVPHLSGHESKLIELIVNNPALTPAQKVELMSQLSLSAFSSSVKQ